MLGGKVVEATPTLSAVSLWIPPGYRGSVTSWIHAVPALRGFLTNSTPADARRFLRWTTAWEKRRRQLLPQPHWYLEMLCADPHRQGYGLGAVLALHGLKRAAAEGTPTFLETQSPQNVRFYSKMGFEVVEAGDDEMLHIPVWRMVCQPERVLLLLGQIRAWSRVHPRGSDDLPGVAGGWPRLSEAPTPLTRSRREQRAFRGPRRAWMRLDGGGRAVDGWVVCSVGGIRRC